MCRAQPDDLEIDRHGQEGTSEGRLEDGSERGHTAPIGRPGHVPHVRSLDGLLQASHYAKDVNKLRRLATACESWSRLDRRPARISSGLDPDRRTERPVVESHECANFFAFAGYNPDESEHARTGTEPRPLPRRVLILIAAPGQLPGIVRPAKPGRFEPIRPPVSGSPEDPMRIRSSPWLYIAEVATEQASMLSESSRHVDRQG
jgi:hypothetical protein